jgi:hypothetical protein
VIASLRGHVEPLSQLHLFALLLAAVGHDVDHPGVNNAHLCMSGAPCVCAGRNARPSASLSSALQECRRLASHLAATNQPRAHKPAHESTVCRRRVALRYNDTSVLENHHACTLVRVLSNHHISILFATITLHTASSRLPNMHLLFTGTLFRVLSDTRCDALHSLSPPERKEVRRLTITQCTHSPPHACILLTVACALCVLQVRRLMITSILATDMASHQAMVDFTTAHTVHELSIASVHSSYSAVAYMHCVWCYVVQVDDLLQRAAEFHL